MILPDYPIENKDQDQLKRFPLATKVAAMISAFAGKESFVIGVEGKWGSGKTSFINLVLGELDPNSIVYFTFNPWNFSDESSLLRDFFIKFADAVQKVTGKSTGKRMKEYAGKLSEVDLGISYEGFSIKPLKMLKFWSTDTSLEAIRKELDNALTGIAKKIVVVIDDIDRLDRKETRLILKLIKLTADFPKTIFILAYDRSRVEDRITEKESGLDGSEYLKKIIQVSFSLPVPDQQELWNLLFKDLDASIATVYGTAELSEIEGTRWRELFQSGFNELFGTIRDIKRYISSLRLDWSIMGKSDVNKIDFLGIEAVRVFAPRFYDAIPAYKELFIEASRSLLERMQRDASEIVEARRKQYQELLKDLILDEVVRRSINGISKMLFPQLDSQSRPSDDAWERELRICTPERFNFYFQLGIPFGEMSEGEIDSIIESMANPDAFKGLILQFKEEKRLRKVFAGLLRRRESLGEEKLRTALAVLWELEKQIDDEREAAFDLDDTDTQIQRLAYHTLKELPGSNRKPLLEGLIRGCPNIFYPSQFVTALRRDLGKQGAEAAILSDNDLKELEGILLKKIQTAAKNSLKDEKHLVVLLYCWRAWESAEAVSKYIRGLISTRAGLLAFLKAFVGKVFSAGGNFNNLNRHSVGELYPIAEIEALVDAITDDELAQMTREEKEAIDLFKHPRR
jgi:predicted KAP-like P-loop ATPase